MISVLSDSLRSNIIISTGDILNANKKAGRKSNEELVDGLKLTLEDSLAEINNLGEIHRMTNDLQKKITEHERSNISIGAKIFLNTSSTQCLEDAIKTLLNILKVDHVDNVILAYYPKTISETDKSNSTILSNKNNGVFKWAESNEKCVTELKSLWSVLEQYTQNKKICRIGISDLDTDTLIDLYTSSQVYPSIAQISLASCCVVPPSLQDFCNKNEIQLLTHSDEEINLDDEAFAIPGYVLDWTVRYQVHVKCRGVLTAKGYIVGASKHVN